MLYFLKDVDHRGLKALHKNKKTALGLQLWDKAVRNTWQKDLASIFICAIQVMGKMCYAIVMKHIHNEQGQQLYLFTNSQIMNLLTCDPESSLLSQIITEFPFIILTQLKNFTSNEYKRLPVFHTVYFSAYFPNLL